MLTITAAQPLLNGTAMAATAPSGESMPVGNLPGWRQTFTDDFNINVALGSFPEAVASKWGAYPSPWKDTTGYGTYSPHKVVSISGGVLNEKIHTENGVPLVAAILPKVPGTSSNGQLYGRYAVRFRTDLLHGYKMAWMLWPDSGVHPRDGEIDFPERNLDSPNVWGFVHRQNATVGDDQAWFRTPLSAGWHTAIIEWSPNLVVLKLDGAQIGRTTERIPNTPMHWVLQTEVSLTTGVKPASTVTGNVQIDWVAAWAYDSSTKVSDQTNPTVTLTAPAAGATVKGVMTLGAAAVDASAITATKWYIDGRQVGYDGGVAPWSDTYSTLLLSTGSHKIFAKARDAAGNWGTSAVSTITVIR